MRAGDRRTRDKVRKERKKEWSGVEWIGKDRKRTGGEGAAKRNRWINDSREHSSSLSTDVKWADSCSPSIGVNRYFRVGTPPEVDNHKELCSFVSNAQIGIHIRLVSGDR